MTGSATEPLGAPSHRRALARRLVVPATSAAVVVGGEALLVHLGRTYGSTPAERARRLPGDEIVGDPDEVTDHAVSIGAPPEAVWPWLLQMGWGRGGWYTARWVDRLLFPANRPSAERIVPGLQHLEVGSFIPDGPPSTGCGLTVERIEPARVLVLRSTSHVPAAWRDRARLDWTWTFTLTPLEGGRTRFHFRSRWCTAPWWFSLAGHLAIVPADFVMARSMLRGVRDRAERTGSAAGPATARAGTCTSDSGDRTDSGRRGPAS
jgi:hypothetical protein